MVDWDIAIIATDENVFNGEMDMNIWSKNIFILYFKVKMKVGRVSMISLTKTISKKQKMIKCNAFSPNR